MHDHPHLAMHGGLAGVWGKNACRLKMQAKRFGQARRARGEMADVLSCSYLSISSPKSVFRRHRTQGGTYLYPEGGCYIGWESKYPEGGRCYDMLLLLPLLFLLLSNGHWTTGDTVLCVPLLQCSCMPIQGSLGHTGNGMKVDGDFLKGMETGCKEREAGKGGHGGQGIAVL